MTHGFSHIISEPDVDWNVVRKVLPKYSDRYRSGHRTIRWDHPLQQSSIHNLIYTFMAGTHMCFNLRF